MRINFHDQAIRESWTQSVIQKLKNYCNLNKKNGFVLGLSGGASSSLLAWIGAQTGLKIITYTIGNVLSEEQKQFFINNRIELRYSDYSGIENNLLELNSFLITESECNNLLILGALDYTKSGVGRFYKKWHEDVGDIFPLNKIYKTDIYTLCDYLIPFVRKGVYELEPTYPTHQSRWGFSIEDIEWVQEQEDRHKIISNNLKVESHENWFLYLHKQKQLLSQIKARYLKTKHKQMFFKDI